MVVVVLAADSPASVVVYENSLTVSPGFPLLFLLRIFQVTAGWSTSVELIEHWPGLGPLLKIINSLLTREQTGHTHSSLSRWWSAMPCQRVYKIQFCCRPPPPPSQSCFIQPFLPIYFLPDLEYCWGEAGPSAEWWPNENQSSDWRLIPQSCFQSTLVSTRL